MATLSQYQAKRNFKRSPEPRGGRSKSKGGIFVIHKHEARRLHYDLRLELDGVLKSWAVTRGPSLDPAEKRLAVAVEDHPLEYADFEGVIPEGSYGAGRSMLWDRGHWRPEGDPRQGLADGRLTFSLEGEKLRGLWHLIKMKGRGGKGRENWLLIKAEDGFAVRDGTEITEADPDPLSSRKVRRRGKSAGEGISSIDHQAKQKPRERKVTNEAAEKAGRFPDFIQPCLATLVDAPPDGCDWLHEVKFDGYRVQATISDGHVKLLTRNGLDWTHRFGKQLVDELRRLAVQSAVLDGEVVAMENDNGQGVADFAALQADLGAGRMDRLAFFVFDLLFLNGADLRSEPLETRKSALADLLKKNSRTAVRLSEHFDEAGTRLIGHACRLGLEGLVSKRRNAPYRSGRQMDWLKSKCVWRQEFVVIGYSPSKLVPGTFASLLLAYFQDGQLEFAGRVGTGFSAKLKADLLRQLKTMQAGASPLRRKPRGIGPVRWVEPRMVAEVEFRGWTDYGQVRQGSFKGVREDKPAEEVVREDQPPSHPKGVRPIDADDELVEESAPPRGKVKITNPDRVLWPDIGLTKRDLLDYYEAAWSWVAPYIVRRPLSLVRCPGGIEKGCFFQKHGGQGLPDGVKERSVGSGAGDQVLMIEAFEGLAGLVQLGVLELHPWGASIDDVEHPDYLVFDLDPDPGVPWEDIITAAQMIRERLETVGLLAFAKTSGGKGLHVVTPLDQTADWAQARTFARRLAEQLADEAPELLTANAAKRARRGRIFLDYLRNGRGATSVASYSPRARPGAPVATPITWDEVVEGVRPDAFNMSNILQRLLSPADDPWKSFKKAARPLPKLD